MKRRAVYLINTVLLFTGSPVFAWQQPSSCSGVYAAMIEKLEANYIGLHHYQDMGKGTDYDQLKKEYEGLTKDIVLSGCTEVLQEFLNFFEDGHLFVTEFPDFSQNQKDSLKDYSRGIMTSDQVEKQLNSQSSIELTDGDKIIGRYSDLDSEISVIKRGEFYDAFIVKTKKEGTLEGELKARFRWTGDGYKINYHTYDSTSRFLTGDLYKENTLLKISGGVSWVKLDSPNEKELEMINWDEGLRAPKIMMMDENTVLFSVPSWNLNYQDFVALVRKNRDTLLNATTLILDIRGNTGGNGIYFPFFYVFADRNMPGGQGHVLASPDNEKYFKRNLQFSKDIYGPVVEAIQNNMGEIVDGPQYPGRKFKQSKRSKVKNVAILTDGACMSAAESFILHAKGASTKVKTFGSPTRGVIDYTSIFMVRLESGDQKIMFGYPTGTLNKDIPSNGYNKTGIVPDVPISEDVEDKVAFIMDYYRKGK